MNITKAEKRVSGVDGSSIHCTSILAGPVAAEDFADAEEGLNNPKMVCDKPADGEDAAAAAALDGVAVAGTVLGRSAF